MVPFLLGLRIGELGVPHAVYRPGATVLGIGTSTAYRLSERGAFPVPVLRIGGT